jgi:hypothetical protein
LWKRDDRGNGKRRNMTSVIPSRRKIIKEQASSPDTMQ